MPERTVERGQSLTRLPACWWAAARRYCVMEARARAFGRLEPVGHVVIDLQQRAVESHHDDHADARRRANELIAEEAARLAAGGGR